MARRIRHRNIDEPGSGLVIETDLPPATTDADATRLIAVRAGFLKALVDDPRVYVALCNRRSISWTRCCDGRSRVPPRRPDPSDMRRLVDELAVPPPWREWIGESLVLTLAAMVTLTVENPEERSSSPMTLRSCSPRRRSPSSRPDDLVVQRPRRGHGRRRPRALPRDGAADRRDPASPRTATPPAAGPPKRSPPYQTWGR